jgi:hypothetical protein
MSIKSFAARWFSRFETSAYDRKVRNALAVQDATLLYLLQKAAHTQFGRDHHFDSIFNYEQFRQAVPVRDYEDLKLYIEEIKGGKEDVLWPGKPKYFAKTSGTTSGTKYIPISDTAIRLQVKAARLALQYYIREQQDTSWVDGKMIFLQGSPQLEEVGGIPTGRLSGITYHEVPAYLLKNRKPGWETNCIEDWETKVDRIVEETVNENMTLISGIPPWVLMYFERLLEKTGKATIRDIFPNLRLYVHGGVNFAPYEDTFKRIIGAGVDFIETYPASEGFIAFQDSQKEPGLLLHVDGGIFYEFIPAHEVFNARPTRISLHDVELGINYAVILNTDAGLWGYNIGDTVKFVSKSPYKVVVTGRIKHYISAFGEHVIGEEVEGAMTEVCRETGVRVKEFTVAPQVQPVNGELPYHEWLVEFDTLQADIPAFAARLDQKMQALNIYYKDLLTGGILQPLKITPLQEHAFHRYMESIGKLGGQNKIPRLSNERSFADGLLEYRK